MSDDVAARAYEQHRAAATRLQLELERLELESQLKQLQRREALAAVADITSVADEVLAATKPPEGWEIARKEREVTRLGGEIGRLEQSRDWRDWDKAKALYPRFHELREELARMNAGLPAKSVWAEKENVR